MQLYKALHPEDTEVTEIKTCINQDILKEYLESREKEVVDIMMTLFNREQILDAYVKEKTKEAEIKQAKEAAVIMYQNKVTLDTIAAAFKVSVDTVEQWLGLVNA